MQCRADFNTHTHTTDPGSLADREQVPTAFARRPPALAGCGEQGSRKKTKAAHRLEHRLGQKTGCDFADVTLASHLTKDVAIQVRGLERNPRYHQGLRADTAKAVLPIAHMGMFLPSRAAVARACTS